MREVEGLSYEDMARAMGVSKGTIMSRLFHARQKLQRALADCYAEQVWRAPRERAKEELQAMSLSHETVLELMSLADGELEGDAKERVERLVA